MHRHESQSSRDTGQQTREWIDPRSQLSGSQQGELTRRASQYNAEQDPFRIHNWVHARAVAISNRFHPTPEALQKALSELLPQNRLQYEQERVTLAARQETRAVADGYSFHPALEQLHQPLHDLPFRTITIRDSNGYSMPDFNFTVVKGHQPTSDQISGQPGIHLTHTGAPGHRIHIPWKLVSITTRTTRAQDIADKLKEALPSSDITGRDINRLFAAVRNSNHRRSTFKGWKVETVYQQNQT